MKKIAILKISGEALCSKTDKPYDISALENVAKEITSIKDELNLAIIIGGGNIWRGRTGKAFGVEGSKAHMIGMAATLPNALLLGAVLESYGVRFAVMSAIRAPQLCEEYSWHEALDNLDDGRIVICAGGTGIPGFSTDMGAVTRAQELGSHLLLKGTKVDGIYSGPPDQPNSKFLKNLTHKEFLEKGLDIIVDSEAVAFAEKSKVDIRVFNFFKPGNLKAIISGEDIGSMISSS